MANRTYPNNYFAWYNDDKRVAILCEDAGGSYCTLSAYSNKSDCESNGGSWVVAGTSTNERYDSYQGADVSNGLRITYHSKYETVSTSDVTSDNDISTTFGLDTGMQNALLCYVKARLYDDQGDIQKAQYFRQMYEKSIKQYPSRKSGVRQLSVPRL
jgi:hypothetical protein